MLITYAKRNVDENKISQWSQIAKRTHRLGFIQHHDDARTSKRFPINLLVVTWIHRLPADSAIV